MYMAIFAYISVCKYSSCNMQSIRESNRQAAQQTYVILQSQLSVSTLNFFILGILLHAQYLVRIIWPAVLLLSRSTTLATLLLLLLLLTPVLSVFFLTTLLLSIGCLDGSWTDAIVEIANKCKQEEKCY